MRILVIDDQARTERAEKFQAALVDHDVTYLTSFPATWDIFHGYEVICWDNDLGDGEDVVARLRVLCWDDPETFRSVFGKKTHIVHSANPIAAERLISLFEAAHSKAIKLHIWNFTYDQINRNLTL
jgi:hypothetical protein